MDLKKGQDIIEGFDALLHATDPALAHVRVTSGAWTLTEIVGHLVDSAANNHQRFARLISGNLEQFPPYEAENFVMVQQYDGCDFAEMANFWRQYNWLLMHIMQIIPANALENIWQRPDGPKSLRTLIEGYFEHIQMHSDHYRERMQQIAEDRK
ncbi:MAG: DinB family protein [Desulfovibrio sp.]|uniref:DinB family protein n=1 Tax=Desulfovibrio sp. TaxID=885 RepID=UPI00135E3E13|nr:DinB family protein [Desulfovibrio sp.]MTJ92678.1 DinB family protein [Desulfovibrio sp.]